MEANKTDCEKCIRIAQNAINNNDKEKAIKFLNKALKLYPNDVAQELLDKLTNENFNDNNNNDEKQSKSGNTTPKSSPKTTRRKHHHNNDNNNHQQQQHSTNEHKQTEYSREQLDAVKKNKNCKDFYEILGVPKTASDADLKKQYKKLALQFHPDKNKVPGATEAFKAIGKAFAVLSDTEKRKQYDSYGPDAFDSGATTRRTSNMRRSSHGYTNNTYYNTYWNDDEFSAEEIFNMFFGPGFSNTAAANRHRQQYRDNNNNQNTFVFTQSSNYALLFQLMPILLIVLLSLLSSLMIGEPVYSLQRTNKYHVKRQTQEHKIPYFVKSDFKYESSNELTRLEKQIEEDLLIELRQNCFREKSYKETQIWRARTYGDERLLKRASDIDTPSCDKINTIFNGG